jgi:XTP/dITP diphosphohydrolase
VCAVAFVDPARSMLDPAYEDEATVEGEIADGPRGTFGFGYDPIFFYPPYGCTLGEVDGARKLAVAHRGKAFKAFREWLRSGHGGDGGHGG